jgi:hypothetical protein
MSGSYHLAKLTVIMAMAEGYVFKWHVIRVIIEYFCWFFLEGKGEFKAVSVQAYYRPIGF